MFLFLKSIKDYIFGVRQTPKRPSRIPSRIKTRIKIKNATTSPTPLINNEPIDYLLNDQSTIDLKKSITPPPPYDGLKYEVKGYEGGGNSYTSNKGKSANVYVTVTNTLNMMKKYSDSPFTQWAGTSNLSILPLAGIDFNAFYNRSSMQFFYARDPVDNVNVYTADSSDIVSHELGHAILDSLRPDTWSVASLEVWSFHEAFADLTAILSIMQHEEVLNKVLVENDGNLRINSVMSRLAESMGRAIYNITSGDGGRPKDYLRSAINDFKYVNPGTLPESASDNQLASECHSFGRIFLGAFYDILEMIYKEGVIHGLSKLDALIQARDTLGLYVFKAVKYAPINMNFFESVAKTMLWVDWNTPNKLYHSQMKDIFLKRNIVRQEISMLSAPPVDQDQDGIVTLGHASNIMKLSDHVIRIQGQEDNSLYNVDATVAQEEAFLYDKQNGNVIDYIGTSTEQILRSLQDTIIYLHKSNNVSSDASTPFEVVNGKLIRTYFS